jgi:DNA-binding response OmpR family regulator
MAHILLVESDRILAGILTKSFKGAGHQTSWHVDPQEAVLAADENKPDVVILDLLLAGRSGTEFLYEFRSYTEWQDLPVIIYSNLSQEEVGTGSSGFSELKITAFHYKPTTTLVDLSRSVEKALQLVKT